jgi:hypothetical protein
MAVTMRPIIKAIHTNRYARRIASCIAFDCEIDRTFRKGKMVTDQARASQDIPMSVKIQGVRLC